MDAKDEISSVPDEKSSDASNAAPEKPADKRRNSGCLILFLIALPLIDTFGMFLSLAGEFAHAFLAFGIFGFIVGAALGIFVSVKIKKQPWWSSCRWAIYGLLGLCLLPMLLLQLALFCVR